MGYLKDYSRLSLTDVVVIYIKDQIFSGKIKSGDKLLEADISRELNVSRVPVREALRLLNQEKIITFSPRKSNQVVELSRTEILEIFEIRISLEVQILNTIVNKKILTDYDYNSLSSIVEKMLDSESEDFIQLEKIHNLNTQDMAFHKYIWDVSKSYRRSQILEGLFIQLLIAMNENVLSLGNYKEKANEHFRIIEALKTNNLEVVVSIFKDHIKQYINSVVVDITPDEMEQIYKYTY